MWLPWLTAIWGMFVLSIVTASAEAAEPAKKPNVLFIAVDDLNDWIGTLGGNPQVKTPNLDRLAGLGVNFTNAHCASPVCNPSRTALLSGLRSSSSGVYNNNVDWRPLLTDTVTLPLHFRNNGYYVAGGGKLYHGGFPRDSDWDFYLKDGAKYLSSGKAKKSKKNINEGERGVGGIRFQPLDCEDSDLEDHHTVSWTIDELNKQHDKPFFLACGLHKPHMAWDVPRKYYDMYPLDKIVLPKVLETDLDDVPPAGVKMARPEGDHKQMLESGRWKDAVQGYLAAISYCDAEIGRLLDGLDKSPHKDNTIVVLWGDHGWHLGEKQHWRKFALWEEATRAALMFVVPGMTKPGQVCSRSVDFMSIYPTLAELCDLAIPKHNEGMSIRSLLVDPTAAWDRPALTTHGKGNHAVRTEKWRYIRYDDGGEELYDETKDPLEWTNLAKDPQYAAIKAELAQWFPKTNVPTPGEKKGDDKKRSKK